MPGWADRETDSEETDCSMRWFFTESLSTVMLGSVQGIEGLVWHDLPATYGWARHANISTTQRYVRNFPVGAGEAIMLKNQRRHSSTGPTLSVGVRAL